MMRRYQTVPLTSQTRCSPRSGKLTLLFPLHLQYYIGQSVDIRASCAEPGRLPYTACDFSFKYSDRIPFGADLALEVALYRSHFRFLETDDGW
jgi:hypothetical protein